MSLEVKNFQDINKVFLLMIFLRSLQTKQKEAAPLSRIYLTYEAPHKYADDKNHLNGTTITINFWCKSAKQADQIAKRMDTILESSGFERYTAK